MKLSKNYWSLIKLCLLDYLFYSLFTVLIYNIIGRIHMSDYSFVLKDLLIIPLSPFAILLIEGIPYFLILNLVLLFILRFKFKNPILISFIVSTLSAHLIQYIILFFIDFNKYVLTSMSYSTLTFDKIFVMIPSVVLSVLLIFSINKKSYRRTKN